MAQEVGSIYAKVDADLRGFHSGMQQVDRDLNTTGSRVKQGFGVMGKAAMVGGLAIAGGIAFGLKAAIQTSMEHQKALAQTEAVLKSTGGAANVTAKDILSFSDAMEKKTGVDDLAIQSGQNLLLTFTNIQNKVGAGNDIFNQASSIMADMSVALGQDMSSSAIQLGKALQDPVKGMTALQRAGVSFTQAQKDQVAAMTKAGDTMGAQKLILAELTKEFGGSAEAAGKTLGGQLNILKAHLDDVAQKVGDKLIPILSHAVTWVTAHWPQISAVFGTVFGYIKAAWVSVLQPVFELLISGVERVVALVRAHWPEISDTIRKVMVTVQDIISGVIGVAMALWEKFGATVMTVIRNAFEFVKLFVRNALNIVVGVFQLFADLLHGRWGEAWEDVKKIVSSAMNIVLGYLTYIVKQAGAILGAIVDLIKQPFIDAWDAVKNATSSAASAIVDAAKGIGGKIVDGIIGGFLGIADRIKSSIEGKLKGILSSLNPFSPVEHGGSMYIGEPLADGAIAGWEKGTTGWYGTIEQTIRAVVARAQAQVAAGRAALQSAWSPVAADLSGALRGVQGAVRTPAEKALAGTLPVEDEISKGDAVRAAVARQQAMRDAEKQFHDAVTVPEIRAAVQQIQDLQWAIERAGLQRKADKQRAALEAEAVEQRKQLDARDALQQRHFDGALVALEKHLEKTGATYAEAQGAILKLLRKYGVDYASAGAALGIAFVQGMKESIAAASKSAGSLGGTLAKVSGGISVPHLAEGGLVASTGLAVVHQGEEYLGVGAYRRSSGGVTNITIHMPNYLGSKREAAMALVDEISSLSRNGGGAIFSRTAGVTV